MSERLKRVEEGLRSGGERMLPYRGYVMGVAITIGALVVRLKYPYKVVFYPSANRIPQEVISKKVRNYRGKVIDYSGSAELMISMVHRPNWNPLYRHRKETTQVLLTGVKNVSPQAAAVLRNRLVGREVSIEIIARNKELDAVEAWVWIRYRLRKTSLSHLLLRKKLAEYRPIPSPGYLPTVIPVSSLSQTLLTLAEAQRNPSRSRKLLKFLFPKFFG